MLTRILTVLHGLIFGISLIMPKLHGCTMMAVFGAYDTVVDAMAVDFKSVKKKLKFLIPFGIGIVVGILIFSFLMVLLMDKYPVPVYLFFIGLILGSLPAVIRNCVSLGKFRFSSLILIAFFCLIAVMMGILQKNDTDPYYIEKQPYPGNSNVTLVILKNSSNQTISDWIVEFEPGLVSGASGVDLVHNPNMAEKILEIFGTEEEEKENNAFIPSDSAVGASKEIEPGKSVQFTYTSSKKNTLDLKVALSYKINLNLIAFLLIGGFLAALIMVLPGMSVSFVFVILGINSTIVSAIEDFNLLILLPLLISMFFGIILGARAVKWLLINYRIKMYCIISGLMLGSVYVIFPNDVAIDLYFVIGIAALLIGAAISLTIGMERKSNEDLKITSNNL